MNLIFFKIKNILLNTQKETLKQDVAMKKKKKRVVG